MDVRSPALQAENVKLKHGMQTEKNKMVTFSTNEYATFDYGYAVTNYRAQGQEASAVIYHADTRKLVNFHSFYVAARRAKENLLIYTYNKEEF